MLDNSIQVIESFLAIYGILAVFLLGIFEEIIFFIPMSILFIAAGFFIIDPELKFFQALFEAMWKIGIPGSLGVVVGGLFIYWLIYWSGKKIIHSFGRYIGLDWSHVENLSRKFQSGLVDEAVLIFLRIIPIFPIGMISIFCGFVRIKWKEFVWTTFFGTLFRFIGLAMLGWYLGKEYLKYAFQIAEFEKYLVFCLLIIVVFILIYLYGKQRKLIAQK